MEVEAEDVVSYEGIVLLRGGIDEVPMREDGEVTGTVFTLVVVQVDVVNFEPVLVLVVPLVTMVLSTGQVVT